MSKEGWHNYYVYILTNKNRTVIYTGMTNNLHRRLREHQNAISLNSKSFVAKYKCKHLLYYERYSWVQEAISREKEIKGWLRVKKVDLIKSTNPNLEFLEGSFLQ
ncbi:GIY-YIG nuclease family protein [Croceitalea dokdonensis]|uniref:GIY-YIG nuclease family protein n=1 Tax=Croceitalea dokdonensis TaxID=346188 RepID=UPI0006CA1479|nr:GIY-YIG nuclease family protein [Croceitalea dokdonensis]